MAAIILDGDALAPAWRRQIAGRVAYLEGRGVTPGLATVLVGSNPASESYVARKHADCAETGIAARDIRLDAAASQQQVLDVVRQLNADRAIHGLIVQLPLPEGLDAAAITAAVLPAKDVDGLHPYNLGRMISGEPAPRPCTPQAIIEMLRAYQVDLAGRHVAVIGRGLLVGRPLAVMLSDPSVDAVVTVLHSGVADLGAVTRQSDVVISAAGVPGLVTAAMIKTGATVVGVGISYEGGAMVSDIAEDVAGVASRVTPPHGSVGPLTRAMLLRNLLDAAEQAAAPS